MKETNYFMTWLQHGKLQVFRFHTTDFFDVLDIYLTAGCEYFTDICCDNRLYSDGRLVARQATYQGV